MSWTRWFRKGQEQRQPSDTRPTRRQKSRRTQPQLEALENRLAPAVSVVSLAAGSPLSTANGQSEAVPMHSVSNDGHFTVFSSNATNLLASQNQPPNVIT